MIRDGPGFLSLKRTVPDHTQGLITVPDFLLSFLIAPCEALSAPNLGISFLRSHWYPRLPLSVRDSRKSLLNCIVYISISNASVFVVSRVSMAFVLVPIIYHTHIRLLSFPLSFAPILSFVSGRLLKCKLNNNVID